MTPVMKSFSTEAEMYETLKRWLLRERRCKDAFHAGECRFSIKPAGKTYVPDLVGFYKSRGGHIHFIGIEAKNEVADIQGFFDQAVANLVFCHESYLALPKPEYVSADERVQRRMRDLAMKNRVGLLLVQKSKVVEEVSAPLRDFSLRWYDAALNLFRRRGSFNGTKRWECLVRGYVYDETTGDLYSHVSQGTRFDLLPDDWVCPECGASKADFQCMR